jgi:hypothetical protein
MQQITNLKGFGKLMPQFKLLIDLISITPACPFSTYVSSSFQVQQNSVNRPFGNSDGRSYLPGRALRVPGYNEENQPVISEEAPCFHQRSLSAILLT